MTTPQGPAPIRSVSTPWVLAPGFIAVGGVGIGVIVRYLIVTPWLSPLTASKSGFLAVCAGVVVIAALLAVPVTRFVLRASGRATISIRTHLWCCALSYPLALSSAQQAFANPASILLIFPALALFGTVVGNAWTLWRSSRT